ncbi:MAG TPA: hypothetical protein VIS74_00085 [Chthoniobacterales bacterium]
MKKQSIVLYFAVIAFFAVTACQKSEADYQKYFENIFLIKIPKGAYEIKLEESRWFDELLDRHVIFEFQLSGEGLADFIRNPPHPYPQWTKLREVYVAQRLFSYATMPDAQMTKLEKNGDYKILIADPADNKVYALYWSD